MLEADRRPVPRTAPLDLTVDLTRLRGETLAWGAVLLLALGLRLAGLASVALSPAGARHAYAAYALYYGSQGGGADLGVAAGDPLPTLFGAFLFFLFGVSDQIARLGPVLAGVGLVALTIWLRPYLGRAGALAAGLLLAVSPSFVYFSRQPQSAIYVAFIALLLFVALLRALDRGRRGDAILASVAGALLLLCGPVGLTLLLVFVVLVLLLRLRSQAEGAESPSQAEPGFGFASLARAARAGGVALPLAVLVVVLLGFSGFGVAAGNLIRGPVGLLSAWPGSLLGGASGAPGRGPAFALALLPLYEPLALLAGLWAIARVVTRDVPAGRGTLVTRAVLVVWAGLGAVLLALGGATQPALVLLPALPLTVLAGATVGELFGAIPWQGEAAFWRRGALLALAIGLTLAAWGAVGGLVLQAGQRAGDGTWFADLALTVLALALPVSFLTVTYGRQVGSETARQALALVGLLLLLAYGVRSAVELNVYRAASASEPLVYEASTPDILPLVERLRRLSRDVTAQLRNAADPTGGHGLSVAVDPAVEWPLRWYFRDFPALQVGVPATAFESSRPPQLVFRRADAAPLPTGVYQEQRYKFSWSYPAGQPFAGTEPNPLLRVLGFLLFRDNAPPVASTDVVVGYSQDLATRLFPPAPPQGPFGLDEHAGQGRAPGQFDAPRGIAIAPDGAIYVVDMRNARVERFNKDGSFARQFGGPGRGDGQFWRESGRGPTGIAVDQQGFVYVADTWNHRVEKFTADGAFVTKWGSYSNLVAPTPSPDRTGFFGPRGLAISPAGEVYVTDTGNGRVVVFDRDGKFLREFGSKGAGPNQLNEPVGIALSADGQRVYVADSNNARIAVFDPQGRPLAQWPVEAWRGKAYFEPYLALDSDGRLYATSSTTRQVLKFDQDGRLVGNSTGTPPNQTLAAPIGIALATDRSLYITDTTRNVVVHLAPLP